MRGVGKSRWTRSLARPRPPLTSLAAGSGVIAALLWSSAGAVASPSPVTMNGVPEQVIPQVGEVGLGSFTMPTGTATIGSDTDPSGGAVDDGSGGSGGGATPISLGGSSYDTLMSRAWGPNASSNSETVGVNPVALAATCVVESGCSDKPQVGSISGAFQMMNATYTAEMNKAIADHPELASSLTSGLAGQRDPATQAIAAAQYLKDAATSLQASNVANPTVLDTRGYYNFGPKYAAPVATADGSALMSNVLAGMTPAAMAQNGVTPTTTVQQWRDKVTSTIGASAASQPVLLGA